MREIKKVGVVGAGTMGNGIAHVFALAGYEVVLVDIAQEYLDRAMATISKNMDRQIKKEIIKPEDKEAALARIKPTTEYGDLAEVDFVVEAVVEKPEVKAEVFRKLDEITQPDVPITSNTSSISITWLASLTKRPNLVAGMHFMNPVPVMKLVEVVRGLQSSQELVELVVELSKKLGKVPVVVKDMPGFVSNRVLMPLINEAAFALMEGIADAEGIDTIFKLGMNHPMGPLALADLIGIDVVVDILEYLYREIGDPKFRPCPLLKKMVEAGWLGRKTGKGFYEYQ